VSERENVRLLALKMDNNPSAESWHLDACILKRLKIHSSGVFTNNV
jgi:hypothetical protein